MWWPSTTLDHLASKKFTFNLCLINMLRDYQEVHLGLQQEGFPMNFPKYEVNGHEKQEN